MRKDQVPCHYANVKILKGRKFLIVLCTVQLVPAMIIAVREIVLQIRFNRSWDSKLPQVYSVNIE